MKITYDLSHILRYHAYTGWTDPKKFNIYLFCMQNTHSTWKVEYGAKLHKIITIWHVWLL